MAGGRPGIWFASQPDAWEYFGTIDGFPEGEFPAVAAGPEVLAVARSDTGYRGSASSDPTDWVALGELSGLQDLLLSSLGYQNGWYYALGSESCDADGCPAIYRSNDGISWTRTHSPDGGPISSQAGGVHDMVGIEGGFLAIGRAAVDDPFPPAMWWSADGETWWPQLPHEAFAAYSTQLVLTSIDLGTPNRATLVVDGTEHI
ncbi:MAG: hypothetical protein GY773_18040, partial [Actinomycetia bacterium]|nr:hypothetical protein [Actinomycetes bacterium]